MQHDFDIATADANTGTTMRAAINDALKALATLSSGATEPATPYSYQLWYDTANNKLKIRNADNTAWLDVGSISDIFVADKAKVTNTLFYVTPTGDATTWTATVGGITSYYTGLTIAVKPPATSNSSTTLNINSLGAKKVYYGNNSQGAYCTLGHIHIFVYEQTLDSENGGWHCVSDYYTDTDAYMLRMYCDIKAFSSITLGNIIVGTASGYFHLNSGNAFDINLPILYADTSISAGSTTTRAYLYYFFSIITTQNMTLTPYAPIFIKGTLSGTMFTPVSTTPLTQELPTSDDGYDYMLLGYAYSTTEIYLTQDRTIFRYIDGSVRKVFETRQSIGSMIANATAKTPVANDVFAFSDSEASSILKKITWTNLVAAIVSEVKASGSDVATGTDDSKIVTPKAIKDSVNVPNVAPGSSGNVMTSNGSAWVSQASSFTPAPVAAKPLDLPHYGLMVSAATTERSTTSTSYVKKKEIKVNIAGTYNLYFEYMSEYTGTTCYVKITVNDVQSGSEYTTTSTSYQTANITLTLNKNDVVALYLKCNSSLHAAFTKNFNLQAYETAYASVLVD